MALSNAEKKAIKELHSKLSESYGLVGYRIYGSKATGNDVSGSEIDIMI